MGVNPQMMQILQQLQQGQGQPNPIQPQQSTQQPGMGMPMVPPDGFTESHIHRTINVLLVFMQQMIQSPTPLYQKVDIMTKIGATIQNLNHVLPQQDVKLQKTIIEQKQAETQQELQQSEQLHEIKAQALERHQKPKEVAQVQQLEQKDEKHMYTRIGRNIYRETASSIACPYNIEVRSVQFHQIKTNNKPLMNRLEALESYFNHMRRETMQRLDFKL